MGLDADLQRVRDHGNPADEVDWLLRQHDAWCCRAGARTLRLYPRARNLLDDDDAAQIARATLWRALVDYRYICHDQSCAPPKAKDWRCETVGEWRQHAHVAPHPKVDVGRYVRTNVRLRLKVAMVAACRRGRTFASEIVGPKIDDHALDVLERNGWHVESLRQRAAGDYRVALRELSDEADAVLCDLSRRLLVRLIEGYTMKDAIQMEQHDERLPLDVERTMVRRAVGRARRFMEQGRMWMNWPTVGV